MNDHRNLQPEQPEGEEKKPFVLREDTDFAFEAQEQPAEDKKAARRAKKKAEKESGERRRGGSLLYVVVVLLISVLLAAGIFMVVRDALALMKGPEQDPIEVEIAPGSTAAQIGKVLKEHNVIDYPLFFRLYMKYRGEGTTLQYGVFELRPNMSYAEVKQALSQVRAYEDTIQVTIPEGYTLIKIASLLEKNKVIRDADAFIKYTDTHLDDLMGAHKDLVPADAGRFLQAEGFLFPDTYDFYLNSSDQKVAKTLADHFFAKLEPHMDTIEKGMKKTGLNFVQLISLASVIQKESSKEDQMANVSGVFYNRLKNPLIYPRLESDPTREYANNVVAKESVVPVKKMVDSYNTYVCTGVPAGPICSPGLAAILAAADPAAHNFLFFVTDEEGEFYYSETYEEHQKICWELGYYGA